MSLDKPIADISSQIAGALSTNTAGKISAIYKTVSLEAQYEIYYSEGIENGLTVRQAHIKAGAATPRTICGLRGWSFKKRKGSLMCII